MIIEQIHTALIREQTDPLAQRLDALMLVQQDNNRLLREIRDRLGVVPTPVPPSAPPPEAPSTLTRAGTQLLLGGVPWFAVGWNDPGLIGHDGHDLNESAARTLLETAPGLCVRIWAVPGWPLERVVRAVDLIESAGHVAIVSLGDGAENPGVPENYGPEFYGSGFRERFLPHVRTVVAALANRPRVIFQTMNETAHKGDGATLDQVRTFEHEVAAEIKRLSPQSLVMSGVGDTYYLWSDDPAEYRALLDSPHIDIASLHDYDSYSVNRPGLHGRFEKNKAVAHALNKPIIVDEFGVGQKTPTTPAQRAAALRVKADAYRAGGAAGCLYWRLIQPGPLVHDVTTGDSARDSWTGPVADAIRGYRA